MNVKVVETKINENIKQARKAIGISQEEMAIKLNVVRQTVSKWENGRSVPDADMLIQIAEILNVSVSQLLGTEPKDNSIQSLTDKLARLNEELAKRSKKEKIWEQANKKRGLIIFLSFVAAIVSATVKNELISIIAMSICLVAAVVILYRNLALLTVISTDTLKLKALRMTTLFDIGILLIVVVVVILEQTNLTSLSLSTEKWFATIIACVVMLFGGYIGPKLPYSKHTGLRLPWTVRDEETWNIAHKIIGYISIPFVLMQLIVTTTISHFETASVIVFLLWIGIPGVLSLIYFVKHNHKES